MENRCSLVARKKCPACHSKDSNLIYSLEYSSEEMKNYLNYFYKKENIIELSTLENHYYNLLKCNDCNLVYQEFEPNIHFSGVIYEKWIDPEKAFEHEEVKRKNNRSRWTKEINFLIEATNKNPEDIFVLDYGCGWSTWLMIAKDCGINHIFGTELSPQRIRYAKEKGITLLSNSDIKNYKFDIINSEQVFEHLPTPFEDLELLTNSLSKKGILKISVPNGFDIGRRLNINDWQAPKGHFNSLNPVAPLEHLNCFTKYSMDRMAERAGLKNMEIHPNRVFNDNKATFLGKIITRMRRMVQKFKKYPFEETYQIYQSKRT